MKSDIEEIKRKIDGAVDDASRLAILLTESSAVYRSSPKQALAWGKEAVKLSKKIKSTLSEGRAHFRIALAEMQLSNNDSAESHLDQAQSLFDLGGSDDLDRCNVLFVRAIILSFRGKLRSAVSLLRQALELAGDRVIKRIEIATVLGNTLRDLEEYAEALEYQYQALSQLEEVDDKVRRVVVQSNIGAIYLAVGMHVKAEEYLGLSLAGAREQSDISSVTTILLNLVILHKELKQYDVALSYAKEALELALAASDVQSQIFVEAESGAIALEQNHHKQAAAFLKGALAKISKNAMDLLFPSIAIAYGRSISVSNKPEAITKFEAARKTANDQGQLRHESEAAKHLASLYEEVGDSAKSLETYRDYTRLNGEARNQERERAMVEVYARVEIEKADRERARLETVANAAIERERQLRDEASRRSEELAALALHLVQKNEFLADLKQDLEETTKTNKRAREILSRIDDHIHSDRDWETFESQFNQVHHQFLRQLTEVAPTLTPGELKIAAMLKLNLSTKAIANLLCLSPRTVENHRQSIRKKLKLSADANLLAYLIAL